MEIGRKVYFIAMTAVMSGKVDSVEGSTFTIEGLAGCGGPHVFDNSVIGRSIFLTEEEARKNLGNPMAELDGIC